MATAVARPPHRRQTSDVTMAPLPALGAATSTVTLDGRLLEINDCQQRGRLLKDEDGRPLKSLSLKGAVARPPPLTRVTPEKAPLTPPRVSGVSLAPLPNLDTNTHHHHTLLHPHSTSISGEKSQGGGGAAAAPKIQRRPSMTTYGALGGKAPPPPPAVAAPGGGGAVQGGGGGAVQGGGGAAGHGQPSQPHGGQPPPQQQLIAEGRSIVRSVTLDPWIVAYMDINGTGEGDDADSLCTTPPPRLSMQSLTARGADYFSHGGSAFGPLTPCPLSPSILTVCGQPGRDDQFAFIDSVEELFDMRTCQSPKLPPV